VKALRLENTYLKDLVLIANGNYQQLEDKHTQLLQKYTAFEQAGQRRELEVLCKAEQIKSIFATIVAERGEGSKEQGRRPEGSSAGGGGKGGKREQAEEAYRSIFMKTLRPRKENVHKQA
jgi:hypothetical protein